MSADPRTTYAKRRGWQSKATEPAQVAAVQAYCNRLHPALPGGSRCSFPRCHHESCRGEIQAGLRAIGRAP